MATAENYPPTDRVTRQELFAALDSLADERMGMSGTGFIAALKAGELDPYDPTVARLAILARLVR